MALTSCMGLRASLTPVSSLLLRGGDLCICESCAQTDTVTWTASGLRARQACFARDKWRAAGTADLQFGHNSLTLQWVVNMLDHRTKLWKDTLGS